MQEWTVAVEVLTNDFALVDRWDPPQFASLWFGIHEVEDHQYLTATVKLAAPEEAAAAALAEEILRAYTAAHDIVAQRARVVPTLEPREPYVAPVRWQRAVADGADVSIVWDSGEPVERVEIAESATAVKITLHERVEPAVMTLGGDGVVAQCVRLRLLSRVGERELVDGSSGRRPGDLTVWEFDERQRRERVLALDLDQLACFTPPEEIVHRL